MEESSKKLSPELKGFRFSRSYKAALNNQVTITITISVVKKKKKRTLESYNLPNNDKTLIWNKFYFCSSFIYKKSCNDDQ